MPNLNQTGPFGRGPLTGRRRGRCVNTTTTQTTQSELKPDETKGTLYRVGRGGRPYGGGKGYCHGGPNHKEKDVKQ
ncbi:MAG: hypothetical protein IGBAC_0206 [Ignavibacteriae bacterium]|nr:MAG: hypothetical protein IGBAC_0206 [Ignavibacteriota bacterium]